jgi:dTMP kinase
LDLEWCRNPDIGLLSPDVVLFLDLDIEEAEKRGGFGMERYEKKELQVKVRGEFSKLQDDKWKVNSLYGYC